MNKVAVASLLIVIFLITIAFIVGTVMGICLEQDKHIRFDIKQGYAHYECNATNGETTLVFKDMSK
jgi:hypothetical protein